MAAGVLIGVLILALAVYLLTNFGITSAEVHKQKDINDINKFNTQFTSYEGKECRIQDIVSVVNLAINNNNNYSLDAEAGNSYYITVNIKSVKLNLEKQDINLDCVTVTLSKILNGDIEEIFDIDFDMSGVISDNQKLQLGKYKIDIETYIQSEDTIEKKIMSQMYDFEIVGKSGYGIDASIENAEENEDKLQLFSKDNNSKTLKVIVNKGNLNNAHIKIELQKRTSSFTYTNIENTIVANEINSSELKGENELKIKNTLEGGMYRIIVSLYDEYEDEYSQKVINFMVE